MPTLEEVRRICGFSKFMGPAVFMRRSDYVTVLKQLTGLSMKDCEKRLVCIDGPVPMLRLNYFDEVAKKQFHVSDVPLYIPCIHGCGRLQGERNRGRRSHVARGEPGVSPRERNRRIVSRRAGTLCGVLIVLALVVLVRTAWVCDDAYITFRVVDNFVGGFGLRWNVAERVQGYTHPLWMLISAGAYACTREIYYTGIAVSLGLSVLGAALLARLARDRSAALLGPS